eukprot:498965_1
MHMLRKLQMKSIHFLGPCFLIFCADVEHILATVKQPRAHLKLFHNVRNPLPFHLLRPLQLLFDHWQNALHNATHAIRQYTAQIPLQLHQFLHILITHPSQFGHHALLFALFFARHILYKSIHFLSTHPCGLNSHSCIQNSHIPCTQSIHPMRPPLLHNPSMYRTTSTYRDQPSALPSSICHFSTAYSAQSRRIKPGKSTNVTSIISLLNMLSASYSRVNSSSFLHRAIHFHHCLFATD